MDSTTKKFWRPPLHNLGRRSFLKIGTAACGSLMFGCSQRGRLTRSANSRITLLKGDREWVSSVCTLCPSGCATRAYIESGRIVAVGGDPDDPNTGGKMCPIGLSVLNLHANPDRLTSGYRKKPDGKMDAVQPEEIIAQIAARIRRGGALHIFGRITPFAATLSNTLNARCHMDPLSEGRAAYPAFLNTGGRPPVSDFDKARVALLFDCNILEHGYPFVGYVRRITEARMRGLRLVTLSPFLTNTATAGDWIPVRSRAAASLAALAIARQALDGEAARGAPSFQEIGDLLRSLDPEFLEESSGLSHDAIRELMDRFFSEPGPAISEDADPCVLLLNIMKGNLNRPGGLLHPGRRIVKVEADPDGIALILRDPGNVVMLHQSNPAFGASAEVLPILRSSNRATVVCVDSFMSETAAFSDFVLPLASPLETLTIAEPLPLGKPFIAAAPAAVNPPQSCKSFDDWLSRLASTVRDSNLVLTPERFAIEAVGAGSGKLAADRSIYPMPLQPGVLEADMNSIISSVKAHIESLRKLSAPATGEFSLAVFEESVQSQSSAPSKWLNEITYSPKLYLHPRRAGQLGIRGGDVIVVTDRSGARTEGTALLFEGVHPDVLAVALHHGHSGYGRVALGERFDDPKDPDMSRMFWGENRGINPAGLRDPVVVIQRKRG